MLASCRRLTHSLARALLKFLINIRKMGRFQTASRDRQKSAKSGHSESIEKGIIISPTHRFFPG
jgi:hypothetical protein